MRRLAGRPSGRYTDQLHRVPMSDRPPVPPPARAAHPPRREAEARDAVFEDVTWDGEAPVEAPAYVPHASGDGYAAPGAAPGASGFRIDFDAPGDAPTGAAPYGAPLGSTVPARIAPPAATTALVPLPAGGGVPALPPPPPPAAPRAEARRAARDKVQMLRRHKWAVVACTLLGAAAGLGYSLLTPPRYEAYAVLLVKAPAESGTEAAVTGGFGGAVGTDDSRTLNQALILQEAPAIARQTAEALLARDDADRLSTVARAADKMGAPLTAEALAEYLRDKVVSVTPEGEDVDAIRVRAAAADPHEAALIASLFTERFQRISRDTNLDRVEGTGTLLDEQIAAKQGELDEIEAQLAGYMTRENAAGLDQQTSTTVSGIGTLQSQLDNARVAVRTHSARLGQLERDLASVRGRLEAGAATATVTSPVQTTELDTQIASLERLVEQVYVHNPQLRGNPSAHPDLQNMLSRLEGLRAERRRVVERQTQGTIASGGLDLSAQSAQYITSLQQQISSVRADLQGAQAQVSTLSGRLGQERGRLRGVPRQQVDIAQMERERAALVEALAGLQRERNQTEVAASTELGSTQLVREVQVPRKSTGPKLPMNVGLGGGLGLLLGLALAAVRYRTDARAHTPQDLQDAGFAVVGTIPDVSAALREGRRPVGAASIHPALVTLTQPFEPAAEAFRHLHAGLHTGEARPPQVVLVTGPEIGGGKSLVAGNLAVAAAQAGRRVLLVDADLRKPSVPDLLGLRDLPSLGQGPEGSNLVYWSTPVPSLFAMTPRERAVTPEQLWAPHVVGSLLANLRAAFDLIVIDAAPALVAADATLLAPHADAALLVARAGRTDLDAMTQVATELSGVGLTRIGAVLNQFHPRKAVGYARTAGARFQRRAA